MSDETELAEVANQMAYARGVLKDLIDNGWDTLDAVCADAIPALRDAEENLDDVIRAIRAGRIGPEDPPC